MKKLLLFYFFLVTLTASAQWIPKNNGLTGSYTSPIVSTQYNLYVATNSGVFVSTDEGASWTAANTGLTIGAGPLTRYVICFFLDGYTLYAGTNAGLFYSRNGSWIEVNPGPSNLFIASIARIGNNLFAGTYGGPYVASANGAFWNSVSAGLTNSFINCLLASGSTLFAGTSGGMFVSSNNGTLWTAANTGLTNLTINCLITSGSNLFAGTNGGIFLSTNNGTSWTAVNTGLTNLSINCLLASGSNLFAGTDGGVFVSSNNGTSWRAINTGLTNLAVKSLIVRGNNLFAATNGGVAVRPLSEIVPSITVGGYLFGFSTAIGSPSSVQSFTISGAFLTGAVSITTTAPFEVSLNASSGFGSGVTLVPVSGTVANTPVYVRFNPLTAGTISGNITVTSPMTTTQNIAIGGFTKTLQTITFAPLPSRLEDSPAFTLAATATSGLPVSYASSNPAVAVVSGNTVIIVGAGTTNITASQAGDNIFNPAPNVVQPLTVNPIVKQNQTITFAPLSARTVGDAPFTLNASTSSGLPLRYTSRDTTVVRVSGNTVSIIGVGTVNITVSQPGNRAFNPAPEVTQSFCVKPLKPIITSNGSNTSTTFTLISSVSTGVQWLKDGQDITGATTGLYNVSGAGTYSVRVTANGCSNVSDGFVITAREPEVVVRDFKLYPNPAVSRIYIEYTISGNTKPTKALIYNSMGQQVSEQWISATKDAPAILITSSLKPGNYILRLEIDKTAVIRRIIIQ